MIADYPEQGTPLACTGCGRAIIANGRNDLDDLYCNACNDRFYAAMAAEYPYGQCSTCGAAGSLWLCPNDRQHITFMHVEGMCGQWSDREPEYDSDGHSICDICPRVPRPLAIAAAGFSLDDLPF